MQNQTKSKIDKIVIKRVDDTTIEVELKIHLKNGAKVYTTFRHKRSARYFNEVKEFVHMLVYEGAGIPPEYVEYIFGSMGTKGVVIDNDVIVVINTKLIYLIVRYLMLRTGYIHEVAARYLLDYDLDIIYEGSILNQVFELALLALNSADFETVANMYHYAIARIRSEMSDIENRCKRKLKELEKSCIKDTRI